MIVTTILIAAPYLTLSLNFYVFFVVFCFLAALGLHCHVRAFSSCSERGYLVAAHGFLIMVLLLLLSTDSRHMSSVVAAHKL